MTNDRKYSFNEAYGRGGVYKLVLNDTTWTLSSLGGKFTLLSIEFNSPVFLDELHPQTTIDRLFIDCNTGSLNLTKRVLIEA